nr:MAG TPA: hypothetical protein [Caudoviricetes sp.]
MSIRAPFAALIFQRKKTLEIRKSAPKAIREGPLCVLLYESKRDGGRGKIVGWFTCRSIRRLWGESEREICEKACLESWQLRRYASESRRDVAQLYAWQVEDATELAEPEPMAKAAAPCPPQSWRTLDPQAARQILALPTKTTEQLLHSTAK